MRPDMKYTTMNLNNNEHIESRSQCQYIFAQNIANACQGKPIKKIINSGKYPKWFYEEKMNTVY